MVARKNIDISNDFYEQMKSNLKLNNTETNNNEIPNNVEPVQHNEVQQQPVITQPVAVKTEERKEKYADVMNIRLQKGRRNEIKAFCTSCGLTVTQYIESSFEYLSQEVAAGRLVISKGGITKKNI